MEKLLLSPPGSFLLFLVAGIFLLYLLSKLSFQGSESAGKRKPYACGEDIPSTRIQPDFSQFFAFAFFFTVMHVVGLLITLIPSHITEIGINGVALVYILCALIGLSVLLRR